MPLAEQRHARHRDKPPARLAICQVLHSLAIGGAEVLAANLARRLGDRFRFVFACLDDLGALGEELRAEGFPVHVLDRRPGFDLRCVRRLAEWVRAERADVVHAHQYTPFFYARAPGVWRRRPPVLFNEHGRFHPDFPRPKRMAFNRWALRRGDRVVGVGDAVRQALIRNEGIPGERVQVIYNGVDLKRFAAQKPSRDPVRRDLGFADDDFVVVQVARLDPLKDHLTAVRALECAVQRNARIRLVLVGEGPERAAIEREIAQRGLGTVVRLAGQQTDVPRWMSGADAFLLTSISEGIPVTLIEAMAGQLPVVATDVGGVAEVVAAGETGLLAPAGDAAALAAALLELVDRPDLRLRLGRAGRDRAEGHFSESQMHAAYARLYEEMAAVRCA